MSRHAIYSSLDSKMSSENPNSATQQSGFYRSPAANSAEYIIVTTSKLADSFEPLIKWKRQLGYSAEVTTLEAIYSQFSGIDSQERIRNFLIQAHANGTRWVLLGGDEDVVPVRYAFHHDRSTNVSLDLQQICDLYYADLTGNWDVDGDGLYGEPTDDAPDITPELMVGRVPVHASAGVAAYAAKSISYEKYPGNGDSQFALRCITAASDQMRDYYAVGQDAMLANALPPYLDVDTLTLAEAPSGCDDAPESPMAADFVSALSDGYNLAYLFAHGMANGFVSKSSGYNHWPKSFVLTGESTPASHATLCSASNIRRTGVVYSVGCNNGAFDMDKPPDENVDPCVAERLLTLPGAGAAAFVGYSRWGWVATSYKFALAFDECIFSLDNRLAPANNYSKASNYTIRDLVYGLNVYGDPSLRIWTDIPRQMQTSFPKELELGANDFSLDVTSGGEPLDSALVTIVGKQGILFNGMTNSEGSVDVVFMLNIDTTLTATVSKAGYIPMEEPHLSHSPARYR